MAKDRRTKAGLQEEVLDLREELEKQRTSSGENHAELERECEKLEGDNRLLRHRVTELEGENGHLQDQLSAGHRMVAEVVARRDQLATLCKGQEKEIATLKLMVAGSKEQIRKQEDHIDHLEILFNNALQTFRP